MNTGTLVDYRKVRVGRGRGLLTKPRADEVAMRLYLAGIWDGASALTIHEPGRALERIRRGGAEALVHGEDYEIDVAGDAPLEPPAKPGDHTTVELPREIDWL